MEKRVANTKELPGLDRTDDIKKGSTQLLLMSRLKFGCAKRALKTVLLGNLSRSLAPPVAVAGGVAEEPARMRSASRTT